MKDQELDKLLEHGEEIYVSRETATRDLKEMIYKKLLKTSGQKGAGAFYTLN